MIKQNYIHEFNKCKKYEPSDMDIRVLRKDLQKYIQILTQICKENNITDPDQIKVYVTNLINMIFDNCGQNSYIDSALYEFYAVKDILKDHSILDKEYENIKDTPYVEKIFTADKTRSYRLALIKVLNEIRQMEEFAQKHHITGKSNINDYNLPNKTKEQKQLFQLLVNLTKESNMRNKILLGLEAEIPSYENSIRETQISSLKNLHEFFKSFGFSEAYVSAYNSSRKKFGIKGLDITEEDFDNIFSQESLEKLSTDQLCFLNTTWCNRFAKETYRLTATFNAINSMNLWQDIINGNTNVSLPDNCLKASLKKSNFLKNIVRDSFNIHSKNVIASEYNGTASQNSFTQNYTDFYKKIQNLIQEHYDIYFRNYGLVNNDFLDDAALVAPSINLEMFLYRKKDTTLEPNIMNMLNNNYCKNWGISRYEYRKNELIDTIAANKKKVLLAFDIEGFNMPLLYHIDLEKLIDIVKTNNCECIIPEYEGHDDFIINDSIIPSNIVMPIPKSHRKTIMDNSKIEGPTQKLWQHLYFLMNGKLPEHFTETIKLNSKKTATVRKPIYYSSLTSGKRFLKEKNNFIEVDNDGR